jgi:hypothetical protein
MKGNRIWRCFSHQRTKEASGGSVSTNAQDIAADMILVKVR